MAAYQKDLLQNFKHSLLWIYSSLKIILVQTLLAVTAVCSAAFKVKELSSGERRRGLVTIK